MHAALLPFEKNVLHRIIVAAETRDGLRHYKLVSGS